jgi:hypothetical protein
MRASTSRKQRLFKRPPGKRSLLPDALWCRWARLLACLRARLDAMYATSSLTRKRGVCSRSNRIGWHSGETLNNFQRQSVSERVLYVQIGFKPGRRRDVGRSERRNGGGPIQVASGRSRRHCGKPPREDQAPPVGSSKRGGIATTSTNRSSRQAR